MGKVFNVSSHPNAIFQKLVAFVLQGKPMSFDLVILETPAAKFALGGVQFQGGETGPCTQGMASETERNGVKARQVSLFLSKAGGKYPRVDSWHLPGELPVIHTSWESEVLHVLAHEVQHIRQYEANSTLSRSEKEREAEAAACRASVAWAAFKARERVAVAAAQIRLQSAA